MQTSPEQDIYACSTGNPDFISSILFCKRVSVYIPRVVFVHNIWERCFFSNSMNCKRTNTRFINWDTFNSRRLKLSYVLSRFKIVLKKNLKLSFDCISFIIIKSSYWEAVEMWAWPKLLCCCCILFRSSHFWTVPCRLTAS